MDRDNKTARISNITIGSACPLAVIAGPCVIESREHLMRMADGITAICGQLGVPLVFKASYDKANRTSVDSFRGVGLEAGVEMLSEVASAFDVPVLTDIHLPGEASAVGQAVDCLQIPAFLCRQTDLLVAAAKTGKCVNVKKGQFMAPEQMAHAVDKIRSSGGQDILLTDRGTFFGYNCLVNDMTCIPRMKAFSPVVFDATHSCQQPGAAGKQTGGQRQFVETLAMAAVAAGADAVFLEVHDDPDNALSDSTTQLPLDRLESILARLLKVRSAIEC